MAQMERSAKKLPANLANRNFKAEADKAKTPAERDKLLRMRDAKLGAMGKMGDKNTTKYAQGDELARDAAMKRMPKAAQAEADKGKAVKPAGAKSTALAMTKATAPIIKARVAKAAGAAPVAKPAQKDPLAGAKARIRAEFQSGVSPSETRMAERKARRAERKERMDGAKARIRAEFQAKK